MKITNKEREQLVHLRRMVDSPSGQFLTLSDDALKTCQNYYKELGKKYGFDGTKVVNVKVDGEVILDGVLI